MTHVHLDEDEVWKAVVAARHAADAAGSAKAKLAGAGVGDFGEFTKTAQSITAFIDGIIGAAHAVADDLAERTSQCLGDFVKSDHQAAGSFPQSR